MDDPLLSQFDSDAGASNAGTPDVGEYGTPTSILNGLQQTESSGNQYAINKQTKAMGPYQFMPETVAALHQQGIKFDPFDPQQARDAADMYLSKLAQQNGGDYSKALAQYGGFKTKDPSTYIAKVTGQQTPASSPQQADPLLAQFDSDSSAPAAPFHVEIHGTSTSPDTQSDEKPGIISSAAAGAGKMLGSGVLTLQQLAGYGLGKLGTITGSDDIKNAGDWLYNDATTGARNLEQQNAPYAAAHPVANVAGQVAGFAGGMLTKAGNLIMPFASAAPAASMLSAAGRGLVQGGVLNMLTSPATDPNDSFLLQKGKQALLGAAGGGAGGVLGYGLSAALNAGVGAVKGIANRITSGNPSVAADQAVAQAVKSAGIAPEDLPADLYGGLKALAQKSIESGTPVDPQALARLAKAQTLPVPINPMRFQLTRDPMDFAVGTNLRGITGVGEPIAQRMTEQNAGFLANLDAMGAKSGEDIVNAAKPVISTLAAADKASQQGVTAAYNAFKASAGKDLEVPLQGLAQDYANVLQDFGKAGSGGGVIPGGVSNNFEALGLQSGTQQKTFSIENAENLIKTINQNYDPANRPQALALDQLRQSVQRAISEGAGSDVQGAAAAQLAQQARSAAAQRFAALDANPAMRAAVSDMPPDKFLSSYVMQGNEGDIKQMMSSLQAQSPAQAEALQNSMMRHLKGVATGFRPDDKAVVSEAAMNQMVNNPNSAARNKALFGPQKFGQLQQLADVVGDMKWAPVASAINTSNTAATGANFVKSTVQGGPLNALLSGAKIVPGLSGAAGAAQQSLQSSRAAGLVGQTMAHSVGDVPKNIPLSALMKQGVDQLAAPAGAIAAGSRRRQPQQ